VRSVRWRSTREGCAHAVRIGEEKGRVVPVGAVLIEDGC